jgi:enoyl-CoA hydratase/carnithine racemase
VRRHPYIENAERHGVPPNGGILAAFGSKYLRYEVSDGAAWLTVDRPQVKNAMSMEMYRGVGRAMEAADIDDNIHVTVITGVDELLSLEEA